MLVFVWSRLKEDHRIDAREGAVLIGLFVLYLVYEYGISGLLLIQF